MNPIYPILTIFPYSEKRAFLLFFIAVCPSLLFGQRQTISGQIIDEVSKRGISDAHVIMSEPYFVTVTDSLGNFSFSISNAGKVQIQVSHIRYQTKKVLIDVDREKRVIITMVPFVVEKKEVTVLGKGSAFVQESIPGKLKIRKEDLISAPSLFGEPDLIRSIQMETGIQSVSEGNSGIYVRGGENGQNLVIFDEMEIINPTHLMGIYSAFNPLMVNSAEIYKGNAPVQYKGRLSSVILAKSSSSIDTGYHFEGNLGNLSSSLYFQDDSKNGKMTFQFGARRTQLEIYELLASALVADEKNYFKENHYSFYDLNGKITYKTYRNTVSLNGYLGSDDFLMSEPSQKYETAINWGNSALALSWIHSFSSALYMKNVWSYAGYHFSFMGEMLEENVIFKTNYDHYKWNLDFSRTKGRHNFHYGTSTCFFEIQPKNLSITQGGGDYDKKDNFRSLEVSCYWGDDFRINNHLSAYSGINLSRLVQLGPYSYLPRPFEENAETIKVGRLKKVAGYWLTSGNISINWLLNQTNSIKWSYACNNQNLHLASIASIPLPADIWMLSSRLLKPEYSHQVSLGYYHNAKNNIFEWNYELYAKRMTNQLIFYTGFNESYEMNFEDYFFKGEGRACGMEFSLRKKEGFITGHLAYTLGWTQKRFPELNGGDWFYAKYDRRHDLSLTLQGDLSDEFGVSVQWLFASGNRATLPEGRMWLMGYVVNDYNGINNFTYPAYHRLDLGCFYNLKSRRLQESRLHFSIVNVYNRANPYFIYFKVETDGGGYNLDIKAKQVSLFPIMPSLSWSFKF